MYRITRARQYIKHEPAVQCQTDAIRRTFGGYREPAKLDFDEFSRVFLGRRQRFMPNEISCIEIRGGLRFRDRRLKVHL